MSGSRTTLLAFVLLAVCNSFALAAVAVDTTIFKDQLPRSTTVTITNFSTTAQCIASGLCERRLSDGDEHGGQRRDRRRSDVGARPPNQRATGHGRNLARLRAVVLTNVNITATLSQSVVASMTVMSFTGVDPSGANGSGAVGATGTGNAMPALPL